MKNTPFKFGDRILYFSFTADALFQTYDKFGVGDIFEVTHCLEPTAEGWKNCCWLAALMAAQGELQRRAQGYDRSPMVEIEALRTQLMAVESTDLRMAVKMAIGQGIHRDIESPDDDEEVDVVLLEREAAEKKTKIPALSGLASWLSQLSSLASPPSQPSP